MRSTWPQTSSANNVQPTFSQYSDGRCFSSSERSTSSSIVSPFHFVGRPLDSRGPKSSLDAAKLELNFASFGPKKCTGLRGIINQSSLGPV